MDLEKAMMISASGLKVQSTRMRVIAENMANADSIANTPGADPYRRKTVTFKNVLDRELGVHKVTVDKVNVDRSALDKEYDPTHPGADSEGYVKQSNVSTLIEAMDMREAQRTYEGNLSVVESSRSMMMSTIDLLR
jgi:flagellar basal-body rod protein FlgC